MGSGKMFVKESVSLLDIIWCLSSRHSKKGDQRLDNTIRLNGNKNFVTTI